MNKWNSDTGTMKWNKIAAWYIKKRKQLRGNNKMKQKKSALEKSAKKKKK